jgi:hypothetical protein
MSSNARLTATALAAVAVFTLACAGSSDRSSPPSATPSPVSSPSPTSSPSPLGSPSQSPSASPGLSLTERFVSNIYGISVAHPAGWTTRRAIESWPSGSPPRFDEPFGDLLFDPVLEDHLFIGLYSRPIGDLTGEDWLAEQKSLWSCNDTTAVLVDGSAGFIGHDCLDANVAFASSGDRGYLIWLYASLDDQAQSALYDSAFPDIVATVQLDPEGAR